MAIGTRLPVFAVLFALLPVPAPAQVIVQTRPGVSQPRDQRQQRQQTGTASISGRITAAESGVPLRRVQVRVAGPELRGGRVAMTDADGKFTIANLPAGRYTVACMKAGYATTQYGQKRPNQGGQPIDLSDGQKFETATVSLVRGGVIAGRVFDDFGEPIVDARISVMQYRWNNGRRRLQNMGRMGQSNDRGEYRVWGLGAGEFYVSATANDRPMFSESAAATLPDANEPASFAPTYYPGTAIVDEAQRVAVAAGQEVNGVDFNLVTTRTLRVSGTAMTSDGKPMSAAMVMVMPRNLLEGGVMIPQGAQTDSNGAFTLSNVAPGEYMLQARPMGMGLDGAGEVASMPLTVTGSEDVRNVMLVASKGVRVTGRVTFEGVPPGDAVDQMNIFMAPAPGELPFGMMGPSNSRVTPERTFEIKNVLGKRTVAVMGLPSSWVIKAARIGGTDILDTGYEFGKEDVTNVEVVVTRTATTVTGKVTLDEKPVTDYVVVAFPTDEDRWQTLSPRRFGTARPDQNGLYQLRNLPPGSYYVLALDTMPEEWGNPELFKTLKDRAKRVTLQEGESESLDLTLQTVPVS